MHLPGDHPRIGHRPKVGVDGCLAVQLDPHVLSDATDLEVVEVGLLENAGDLISRGDDSRLPVGFRHEAGRRIDAAPVAAADLALRSDHREFLGIFDFGAKIDTAVADSAQQSARNFNSKSLYSRLLHKKV